MISYTDMALFPLALQATGVHYALIYSLIRSVSCNKQMFTLSHSHTRRSGNVTVIQLFFLGTFVSTTLSHHKNENVYRKFEFQSAGTQVILQRWIQSKASLCFSA